MTGTQSRKLQVGTCVYWMADRNDDGVIVATNWSSVVVRWKARGEQVIMHNNMECVTEG
jgi:hypothetical protein